MTEYQEIVKKLIEFRNERDWAQFHDSKNLALALFLEAAELNELFLWKKDSETETVDKERLKERTCRCSCIHIPFSRKAQSGHIRIVRGKDKEKRRKVSGPKAKGTAKKYNEL